MLLIWNGPHSWLQERTNKRKRWILHLLKNHLAVSHHEPDLDLLAKTESGSKIRTADQRSDQWWRTAVDGSTVTGE